ncbi:MAG TPA: hypothetical protein VGX00_08525 [Thermoplasmata archaeon]|nr:hypothetical protein [Thermoplasmata archaeon]
MTVDGAAVRDRLLPLVPPGSLARPLVDQLCAGMDDATYTLLVIAITRSLAEPKGALT